MTSVKVRIGADSIDKKLFGALKKRLIRKGVMKSVKGPASLYVKALGEKTPSPRQKPP